MNLLMMAQVYSITQSTNYRV